MKVGIFPMVADLLHAGHLKAIEQAKKCCDYLIVALNCDPTWDTSSKNKPIERVYERYVRLDSNKYVDKVIPYSGEEDLLFLLQTTDYQVRFIGSDHKDNWTGKLYEDEHGIDAVHIERSHNLSSTSLRERILNSNQNS